MPRKASHAGEGLIEEEDHETLIYRVSVLPGCCSHFHRFGRQFDIESLRTLPLGWQLTPST